MEDGQRRETGLLDPDCVARPNLGHTQKKLKICSHNLHGWLEEIKVGITLVTSFPSLIIEMY